MPVHQRIWTAEADGLFFDPRMDRLDNLHGSFAPGDLIVTHGVVSVNVGWRVPSKEINFV